MMPHPRLALVATTFALAPALGGALLLLPARAAAAEQQEQGLRLYGGIGWGYDDNLLRVPDDRPAFSGKRSDRWRQLDAGAVYDQRIGRQRVALVAKASTLKFDHFQQLDHDGRDLQGTWFWEVGNKLDGKLGARYERALAPYTDFFSDERNMRELRRHWVDAGYQLHPSWKLRAGFTRERFEYELLRQRVNNRTERAVEAELLYTPRSGSSVGVVARRLEGAYPLRRPVLAGVLDDDFTQHELKLRVHWIGTGVTRLQALAGYVRRGQSWPGDGNTSGVNGRLNAFVTPHGKLSYEASLWREFAPIESTIASYTLNRGASIGASWAATGKLKVDASTAYEERAYNPRAGFAAGADLSDSLRRTSLRATWQASRKVTVSARWQQQRRSGSPVLGLGSFDANTVVLNANLLF
ncbi:XrtB/PEP-CTERM-associated polysaccharide biosynthesis outer membrane protein EpsL [Massilia sp. H6]|uniref:XrtB/PEP-CTERM-associated polysaccharide biosynthesis outer membrane protein EpsL n=1 Tax=Massilia sp. H6 TaxID=2970464 RepID=UPI0021687702|nr:XrtB/PEP-CTERM-associated polysaccharide biosynthesis outer membrane protein EpsL [Massilia sp. H6]UVW29921.1 exopolysaccharide biosynthesis protein EpsL [Massilia sp. H6]